MNHYYNYGILWVNLMIGPNTPEKWLYDWRGNRQIVRARNEREAEKKAKRILMTTGVWFRVIEVQP